MSRHAGGPRVEGTGSTNLLCMDWLRTSIGDVPLYWLLIALLVPFLGAILTTWLANKAAKKIATESNTASIEIASRSNAHALAMLREDHAKQQKLEYDAWFRNRKADIFVEMQNSLALLLDVGFSTDTDSHAVAAKADDAETKFSQCRSTFALFAPLHLFEKASEIAEAIVQQRTLLIRWSHAEGPSQEPRKKFQETFPNMVLKPSSEYPQDSKMFTISKQLEDIEALETELFEKARNHSEHVLFPLISSFENSLYEELHGRQRI